MNTWPIANRLFIVPDRANWYSNPIRTGADNDFVAAFAREWFIVALKRLIAAS